MDTPAQVRRRVRREIKSGANAPPEDPELDMRRLLRALQAVRDGDFSVRLPSDQTGLVGKIADTFNEIVTANQRVATEIERVGQRVGKNGQTRNRVSVDSVISHRPSTNA